MNAPVTIETARAPSFQDRFEDALGSAGEKQLLMALANDLRLAEEPIWTDVYGLAVGELDRAEAIYEIRYAFAEWDADTAYAEAQAAYERVNPFPADGVGSPAFDPDAWKREYVARHMPAEGRV